MKKVYTNPLYVTSIEIRFQDFGVNPSFDIIIVFKKISLLLPICEVYSKSKPSNITSFNFYLLEQTNIRSSRPEMFCKKGVLKNFTKFTGKYLRWSLFLIKLQAVAVGGRQVVAGRLLQAEATLLKKKLWYWCFPLSFAKFLRTPFL